MAIDYMKAATYLTGAQKMESVLSQHQELFAREKFDEFQRVTESLDQNIQLALQSRKLSIGIVGAMKAGKSSFLNACVFNGQDFLPKAATPMTAALTRISYSEKPKAIIHFYNKEDWAKIVEKSAEYDSSLQSAYDGYQRKYQERLQAQTPNGAYGSYPMESLMMIDEYEHRLFKCSSETLRGAKELTSMASDPTLLEKLGGVDEIDGDIMGKLNNYVGANGKYTPLVSYVELQVDSPYVKDLEIVDTPGLNDPILSRGIVTKQFLRSCDVVLLLSPCSQFMDSGTVTLMANSLPSAGVQEVIVVGSKLDSGILNESASDFAQAYKNALASYNAQFQKSISQVKATGRHIDIVNKIDQGSILFVSSACFSIVEKKKNGQPLDESEQLVLRNFNQNFSNFDECYLAPIGGMKKVKESLEGVLKRKSEIVEGKNNSLLDNTKLSHMRILEKILQEIVSSRAKLETTSAEEMRLRTSIIRDVIDSSREKLMHIFDGAVIGCEAKIQQILPQLTVEINKHQNIQVQTTSRNEHDTEHTGLFGWHREVVHYTVTEHGADTSCVVDNIHQYSARCQNFVIAEFKQIFNKEQFAQKIKEVVLNAFKKSGKAFDEDDILLPLQNVLDKIAIPHIEFDYTKYIDEVETRYSSGYAKNEEIHQLKNVQTRLLNQIEQELVVQLKNALSEISKTLNTQAVSFADQIEGIFCNELEKLQGQVAEREKYISEYLQFADTVRGLKAELSGIK